MVDEGFYREILSKAEWKIMSSTEEPLMFASITGNTQEVYEDVVRNTLCLLDDLSIPYGIALSLSFLPYDEKVESPIGQVKTVFYVNNKYRPILKEMCDKLRNRWKS